MSLIKWDDALGCGVASVDDQHKRLVQIVNELHDAMKAGKGKDALGAILESLADYTVAHFRHEEQIMAKSRLPIEAEHRQQHANLLATVSVFVADYRSGRAPLTMEVINFLKKWLVEHIQGMDLKTFRQMAAQAA